MYSPNISNARRQLLSLLIAIKFMLIRHNYDAVIVSGNLLGNYITWLQSIIFFGKKPTIMIDCLWAVQSNLIKHKTKSALHRLSSLSVDKFVVWARHEISDFSRIFGIPKDKFTFIPFHTTINEFTYRIANEGFVFAGGNSDRDYKTLIEAMRGLDIPLFIASSDPSLFADIDIPPNVTVQAVSHQEFRDKMASSRVTVVPIKKGLLRSPGQQTILNSMAMGKPTIVVGRKDAEDYIVNGETGVIVDYEDALELRKVIVKLFCDEELHQHIASKSAEYALEMDEEMCFKAIYDVAISYVVNV
jgi:glycosyltransferase involved in cell wall biosynthesis